MGRCWGRVSRRYRRQLLDMSALLSRWPDREAEGRHPPPGRFEERDGVDVSDSALDGVPGDEQRMTVKGLRPLTWRFLGQ